LDFFAQNIEAKGKGIQNLLINCSIYCYLHCN